MTSRKRISPAVIPKNTDISLIDLAHIACYKPQDTQDTGHRSLHLRSTLFEERPGGLEVC